jgi:hypothetical protein
VALAEHGRVAAGGPGRRRHRPRRDGESGEIGALAGEGVGGVGQPGARVGLDHPGGGMVDQAGIAAMEHAQIVDEVGEVAHRGRALEQLRVRRIGMGAAAVAGEARQQQRPGKGAAGSLDRC